MAGPFTFPVAEAVPFDGSEATPPFVAENAKDGIIEARDTAPGKARASVQLQHNGNLGNDFWFGYSNLIPSNNTPIVLPWNCDLPEFTFSADRNSMDGRLDFYLNGETAGDIIYSVQFNNVDTFLIDNPNLSFTAGDLLRFRWVDQGQNPRDCVGVLFFLLT